MDTKKESMNKRLAEIKNLATALYDELKRLYEELKQDDENDDYAIGKQLTSIQISTRINQYDNDIERLTEGNIIPQDVIDKIRFYECDELDDSFNALMEAISKHH